MKSKVGILMSTLAIILGIIKVIDESVKLLPPEFPLPSWLPTFLLIVGIVVAGLGWNDELETGFKGIIGLVQNFFADPFRKLFLTVVLAVAKNVSAIVGLPPGYAVAAQVFLAIAAVFSFGAAMVRYHSELAMLALKSKLLKAGYKI